MTRLLPLLALTLVASAGARAQEPFKLILRASEQKLQKGVITSHPVVKSWTLPEAGVNASRKHRKVSTTLSASLDRMFDEIGARQPRPAVFRNVGGSWVATEQTGWVADRAATKRRLLRAILSGKSSANVAYRAVHPERSVRTLLRRGVRWHLASGSSSYAGSPAFREKNILVGASKLDNLFVAPGHEFDFNRAVGEIDASTGFVKGFVISGGTLEKEDGGGICQVSTTVFRALYRAGLPITERHEHSHRVRYYDPVGFEATVYAPAKNLRMHNDTGKYLFVQAAWDTRAKTLRFDVFGANTGRRVRVGPPVITGFKPPAAPSYTPDPQAPRDARRLLDPPMQGMTSVIERVIVYPSGQRTRDVLRSVYRPWGAVYGVRPGDGRLN